MARLIVEAFGRAWVLHLQSAKVIQTDDEDEPQGEEFDSAPLDPHSTGGGSFERRSELEDMFAHKRAGFGFSGGS